MTGSKIEFELNGAGKEDEDEEADEDQEDSAETAQE